jgi:hypothetical protein
MLALIRREVRAVMVNELPEAVAYLMGRTAP